ncbi:MAG: tryptophan--tRNA ligase [Methanomicrobiales archaeon]|nr:tryptophan--tRNA ligase [Methanomicrobiales archaeon]MDI6875878.1 tryptophan--tRNA ligase [Methanomicrobiales archaeon]
MQKEFTPWSGADSLDYQQIVSEFGIEPIEPLAEDLPEVPYFVRRGIVIGHRDYGSIVNAIRNRQRFYVMTGFMPSGHPHLGHLMVMREVVWHVQQGAEGYIAIADREAHAVRGTSWEACDAFGREYLQCLYALGFRGKTYFQSRNDRLKDLAFESATKVNFSDLAAIYGFGQDTSLAHAMSVITQVADILFPQIDGGPAPTVVPVGLDQDPHLRLTRDVAHKLRMFTVEDRREYISARSKNAPGEALFEIEKTFPRSRRYEGHVDIYGESFGRVQEAVRRIELRYGGFGFYTPSSTYHTFMPGLLGGKMSSSVPESLFTFQEADAEVRKKIMGALTGGRATVEEQRQLGGEPERCPVFQLYRFHMIPEDRELEEICRACRAGERLCGICKKEAYERVKAFLADLRERMAEVEHLVEEAA